MKKLNKIFSFIFGGLLALCAWSFGGCNAIDGGGREGILNGVQVTATYDYGLHREGKAVMLYGHCSLFFQIPEEIDRVVAGDVFDIEHTGESRVAESYPGQMFISGKIKSVTVHKAEIVRLTYYAPYNGAQERFVIERDDGTSERIKVANRPDYYITGFDGEYGEFRELSEVSYSTTLFGSYSVIDGYSEEKGYSFSGLYRWHPRFEGREIHPDTQAAVTDFNNNSSFTFKLLSKLKDCDFTDYEYNPGFGCESYHKDGVDYGVKYGFSMYPDEACGAYCITSIEASGEYTVFGLNSKDMTRKKLCELLERHGYTVLPTSRGDFVGGALYGVFIRFEQDATTGEWVMNVGLRSTNDTGIIY